MPAASWFRHHPQLGSVVAYLAIILGTFVFWLTPIRERLDFLTFDATAKLVRAWAVKPATGDVVLIGIDDSTVESLSEPFALWHEHLGAVLRTLAEAKPRAVGLDLVLPSKSYDFLKPGLDRALLEGIVAVRSVAPLTLAIGLDTQGKLRPMLPLLGAVAGPDALGLPYAVVDPDGIVRRFDPRLGQTEQVWPTLTERIVRAVGGAPQSGLVDFACGDAFTYLPLKRVLAWQDNGEGERARAALGGRLVLIGTVLPDVDRVGQPLSLASWEPGEKTPPGLVLQAQLLRSQLDGCRLDKVGPVHMLLLVVIAAAVWFVREPRVAWAAAIAGLGCLGVLVFLAYRGGWFVPPSAPAFAMVFAAGTRAVRDAVAQRHARRAVEKRFGGYVSPMVLDALVSGEIDADRAYRAENLAFMFGDIQGFTTLSERHPPEELVGLLNRWYAEVVEVVHELHGTIDSFFGDGFLALFGSPYPLPDVAFSAGRAAAELFSRLSRLNEELVQEGKPPIRVSIGIATGPALVGNIGAPARHEFTAIGDAVNVAARLQSACKEHRMKLMVTKTVAGACRGVLPLKPLGMIDLAGHTPVYAFGWQADD